MNYDRSYDMVPCPSCWEMGLDACNTCTENEMRGTGIEPASPKAPDPKSDASHGNVVVASEAVATERHVPLGAATQSTTDRTTCRFSGSRRPALGAALLVMLLATTGCESERPLGKCVGLNGRQDPALVYEYSSQNLFWGIIGIGLVYPPIKVALDELQCPVAKRAAGSQ